ncbi:MAG: hypothetical protein CMJ75_03205 [Planctomycetaceae bacterium]|mgnify:CR=1 FL=1|nr:hypothetical protein [Planctomycetaceae bacterium]
MKSRTTVPSGLLLAVLVTTLGCTTVQSWNPFSKTGVPAPVVQADAKSEPTVVEPLAEKVKDVAAPHAPVVEAAEKDEENSLTAAFRKAGTAISSVFRSESDSGLQGDPTSLTNLPKKIDANVYEKAAEVLEKRGDFTGALEQYEKGLEADPNHSLMLVKRARLLTRLGEYQLAEKSYQRAVQAASDDVLPVHDLGLFYAERGRIDAALTMLAMAVKLDPENPRYRNNLARVLIDVDRVDDAVLQLEAVLSPAKARYNAGYLLRERKAYQQARTQLQQAIKLDPSFEEAKHLLADLPAANQFTSAPAPKSESDKGKAGSNVETDNDPTKSENAEAPIEALSEKSHGKGETSERKTDAIGLEFPQSIGQTERPPAPPAPAPSPKDVQP